MKPFAESEGFRLDSNEQDLKSSEDVKLTPTQEQSIKKTLESNQMETSDQFNLFQPTLSVADSPAKTYPLLTRTEKDLKASDLVFGGSWQGSSKIAHLVGLSWKTFQRCSIQEWETFSGSFPRSGMMLSGIVYQRQPLVPLTREIESGLWPTPRALEVEESYENYIQRMKKHPNPKNNTKTKPNNLTMAVKRWPTPNARDCTRHTSIKRDRLPDAVGSNKQTGQLNPTWVEWLMGYPLCHTALNASETQLFLKYRNGLRTGSKKSK